MSMRWRAFVALMSMMLVAAACGSSTDTAVADAVEEATTSTAETTTVAPATTEAPAEEVDAGSDEENEDQDVGAGDADEGSAEVTAPTGFVADAPLLTASFMPVDPGTHRVDTLGTPMSLTTDTPLWVQPNDNGFFVLTNPASQRPDDRDLVFMRPSALSDPVAPNAALEDQGEGWPNSDINGWLDALTSDVEVSDRETVEIDGWTTERFELTLAEGATCSDENFYCFGFATNRIINGKSLEPGSTYRVWWIDQGDEDPIAAIAGIQRESQADWWDEAEAIMATVAFGDVGPNPIPDGDLLSQGFPADAPAGPVTLSILGGVSFELPADEFIDQYGDFNYAAINFDPLAASTELLVVERTFPNGVTPEASFDVSTPLTSIDELVTWLTDEGASVTEVEESTLDGVPARVFDVESNTRGRPPAVMPVGVDGGDGGFGWFTPPHGRIWVAETDLGLLMLTAEAFESADDLPATIERTEAIRATLDVDAIS